MRICRTLCFGRLIDSFSVMSFSAVKESSRQPPVSPEQKRLEYPTCPADVHELGPTVSEVLSRQWLPYVPCFLLSHVLIPGGFADLTPENSTVDYFESEFESVELLGSGKFSDVYQALWKQDGRTYAIKKSKIAFRSLKQRDRCINELRLVSMLRKNPHCVTYHKAWEQKGHSYIMMEFCQEGTLKSLEVAPYSTVDPAGEEELWNILGQIALGLKTIHDNCLVHFDLKPSNIFIDSASTIKIGDFGLLTRLSGTGQEFEPGMEGDFTYMPHEVLNPSAPGAAPVGTPVDIFSLGIVMFELASSTSLSTLPSRLRVLTCSLDIEPPPTGPLWLSLRSDISAHLPPPLRDSELGQLIIAMCHSDPRKRPSCTQILSHKRVLAQLKPWAISMLTREVRNWQLS
jgi:serine/threonine protein kinase